MNRDRWSIVNRIFHAALEVDPGRRRSFVAAESNGDHELQNQVELLIQADAHAGSYLESPLVPSELIASLDAPLLPGDELCGRFRIVREIAAGGMGHVFEAFDSELTVPIAIKVIRPEIASNPEAVARFRQEVRLARDVTHPNICRTFDLEREVRHTFGRKTELLFLTMEFLPGETLSERLRRDDPIPLDESFRLATQMAGALSAAHALGIVHRDIKPGNIMLVPADPAAANDNVRAVITDFGLARLNPIALGNSLSSLGTSEQLVGTLAYMAPEQLESGPASPATDIYAFGLILYEMVTGTRAFPSENPLKGLAERLHGTPPSPRSLIPSLPAHWCRAIEACLRINPSERPSSAEEVIALLGGNHGRLSPIRRVLRRSPWPASGIRRLRFARIGVSIFLALALLGIALRLYRSTGSSTLASGALVYLAPVSNQTRERSMDNLTELIQASLSQSTQINLLDQGRAGDILQQMTKSPDTAIDQPTAREIALRAGAARVVFATVTGDRGSYRMQIDIQQPDAGDERRYRNHWEKSFAWRASASSAQAPTIPPELSGAVRDSSDWIRNLIGEAGNDIARLDAPPEDVTTRNWQALADYGQAEKLARDDQFDSAVASLQRAVQEDPQFALAYGRMGDILLSLHRDEEGFRAYDLSLEAAMRSRLTRREEDRIRGMRAEDTADYQLAVDAFRDYTVYYGNDYVGWIYPTVPLRMLGRNEEAIRNLRRAIALDPARPFAPFALAEQLLIEGRVDEARQWLPTLRRYGHEEVARELEVMILIQEFEYDQATRILQTLTTSVSPIRRALSFSWQAELAAEQGRFAEALDLLGRAALEDDASHSGADQRAARLISRSYLHLKLRQFAECLADVHAALALSRSTRTVLRADSVLGNAFSAAPAQFHPKIREELKDIERHLPDSPVGVAATVAHLRTRGEILLANVARNAALDAMRSAAAKDAPAADKEYLGRALALQANEASTPAEAVKLRKEAQDAYASSVFHPAMTLTDSADRVPGLFADELQAYLHLSERLGDEGPAVASARQQLSHLRGALPQFLPASSSSKPIGETK